MALLLLVACANIASLFLVRGSARRRELGLRAALGATRGRIVTQLVTEAAILAIIGGALGLLVARMLVQGLLAIGPTDLPRVAEIGTDRQVALFTLGISLAASLLFGLAPAIQASRGDLRDALKGGDRAVSGGGGRLRGILIVAEVGICTLLSIAAALLARSFQQLSTVDPGFRSSQVLTVRLSLPRARYNSRAAIEKETTLEVYVPMSQVPDPTTIWLANNMYWVIETTGEPLAATNAVRREIAAVDPAVPASFVRSMDQWLGVSIAPRRFNLELVAGFALAALLLAVIGVYAVSASAVSQRTREIGIRSALGASKAQVIRLMPESALGPVLLGLIAGITGALFSGRAIAGLLFGVAPDDPLSLVIVAVTLIGAALTASYMPARRAGKIDRVIALHAE